MLFSGWLTPGSYIQIMTNNKTIQSSYLRGTYTELVCLSLVSLVNKTHQMHKTASKPNLSYLNYAGNHLGIMCEHFQIGITGVFFFFSPTLHEHRKNYKLKIRMKQYLNLHELTYFWVKQDKQARHNIGRNFNMESWTCCNKSLVLCC